jgi:hypothetical protein
LVDLVMVTAVVQAGLFANSVLEGEVDSGPGVEVYRVEKRQPVLFLLFRRHGRVIESALSRRVWLKNA